MIGNELGALVHGDGLQPRHRSGSSRSGRPCSLRVSVTHVPGQRCYLCTRFVPGRRLTSKCSCRARRQCAFGASPLAADLQSVGGYLPTSRRVQNKPRGSQAVFVDVAGEANVHWITSARLKREAHMQARERSNKHRAFSEGTLGGRVRQGRRVICSDKMRAGIRGPSRISSTRRTISQQSHHSTCHRPHHA